MPIHSAADRVGAQHVPGVASLAPDSVKRLLEVGRLVHIPRGWTPIQDGEPADKAYLILEGSMEVVHDDQLFAHVGVGGFVGEMGLVDRSLRSARVTVTEPVLAVAWPRSEFQTLRQECPDFDDLVSATAQARILENDQRN